MWIFTIEDLQIWTRKIFTKLMKFVKIWSFSFLRQPSFCVLRFNLSVAYSNFQTQIHHNFLIV